MTAADYQKKLERDRRDRIDRSDPERMLEVLRTQFSVTRTQMRTLVWDFPDEMERALRATPEVATVFINLVRDTRGNAIAPDAKP